MMFIPRKAHIGIFKDFSSKSNIPICWIEHFIIAGEKDEFAWYDMGVGQRATKLPYMLRRLIEIDGPPEIIFNFIIASEIHISELSQLGIQSKTHFF